MGIIMGYMLAVEFCLAFTRLTITKNKLLFRLMAFFNEAFYISKPI